MKNFRTLIWYEHAVSRRSEIACAPDLTASFQNRTSSPVCRAQGLAHFERRQMSVSPAALPAAKENSGSGSGGAIFFTKNGRFLGLAFRNVDVKVHECKGLLFFACLFFSLLAISVAYFHYTFRPGLIACFRAPPGTYLPDPRPPTPREQRPLYPVIGLDSHCLVTTNFGSKAFAFDVPAFESWFTGTKLNCYAPSAPEEGDEVSRFTCYLLPRPHARPPSSFCKTKPGCFIRVVCFSWGLVFGFRPLVASPGVRTRTAFFVFRLLFSLWAGRPA